MSAMKYPSVSHQTFQVPKMAVLTYISYMDTAYVPENPPPKYSRKFQVLSEVSLHFRYLKRNETFPVKFRPFKALSGWRLVSKTLVSEWLQKPFTDRLSGFRRYA